MNPTTGRAAPCADLTVSRPGRMHNQAALKADGTGDLLDHSVSAPMHHRRDRTAVDAGFWEQDPTAGPAVVVRLSGSRAFDFRPTPGRSPCPAGGPVGHHRALHPVPHGACPVAALAARPRTGSAGAWASIQLWEAGPSFPTWFLRVTFVRAITLAIEATIKLALIMTLPVAVMAPLAWKNSLRSSGLTRFELLPAPARDM